MTNDEPLELDEWNFIPTGNVRTQMILCCTLGGVMILGAALGFATSLRGPHNPATLHFTTTLPTMVAVGALGYAWRLYRLPKSITVSSTGLTIESASGETIYPWDKVGWSTVDNAALNMQRQLLVYDVRAKRILKLTEAVDDFNTLVELIKSHIEAKSDSVADFVRLRKARRMALFFVPFGALLIAGGIFLVVETREKQRTEKLLAESGVPGMAQIVSRHLAPNGVTPRLEYQVKTEQGTSATRNAEITRPYWDSLEGATEVPVVYVPSEPDISVLLVGEVKEDDPFKKPVASYGLALFIFGFGIVMIAVGILSFCGYDIGTNPKTKKFGLKRYGT